MEEKLISFETARLANEKGFDIWCRDAYFSHEFLGMASDIPVGTIIKDTFGAPTQTLLQKWLRCVNEIDVIVLPVRFTGYLEIGYYTYAVKGIQPVKNYRFDTYELALESALAEGLNLIEL